MRSNGWHRGVTLLSLILFLGLATHQLALPGLNYDEAFDAVPAMQILLNQPQEPLRGSGLHIAGRTWPLMVMDYKGVVHTYWALPFLWALGVRVFALRLSCVFLGLLTIAFTHRLARELYGGWTAAVTVLLLAVNPSFLFWSRQGVLWSTAMLTCGMGALAALSVYRRCPRAWRLGGAAFLLGLGMSTKLAFFWFPIALVVAGAVLGAPRLWRAWHSRTRAGWASRVRSWSLRASLVLVAFLLGLLPVLLYNLQTMGTWEVIRGNLRTSYYGVNNLAYLANLGLRLDHLRVLLDSTGFWYLGSVQRDGVFAAAFWVSLAIVLIAALGRAVARRSGVEALPLAPWLFPPLMMALIFAQSGATVSGLWLEHYLLLLPFPQLIVALGLDGLRRGLNALARQRPRLAGFARLSPLLVAAVVLLIVAGQVRADLSYHRELGRSGGLVSHSDAIYELADVLEQAGRPVVAMDWGIKTAVQFLTQGSVNPVERFGFQSIDAPGPDFAAGLEPYLADPETIYVFHTDSFTIFGGRRGPFEELAAQRGLALHVRQTIAERGGLPMFELLEAVPP